MTISGISSSNTYMTQLASMRNRSAPLEKEQVASGKGSNPFELLEILDQDGSGLDITEFQTLAASISEATGENLDVEELFSTYDEDGDGILNQDETATVLEAYKPKETTEESMVGAMAGMQPPPPDFAQLFSNTDKDTSGSLDATEAQSLADMISQATGTEIDAEALLASYDEDEDGTLSENETLAALEANRPAGPPPPPKDSTETSDESSKIKAAGIESYLKNALLAAEQDPSWASISGGNFDDLFAGAMSSVNTQA